MRNSIPSKNTTTFKWKLGQIIINRGPHQISEISNYYQGPDNFPYLSLTQQCASRGNYIEQ